MIRFLEGLSFFLEWSYVFVFLKTIHAFLPLRRPFLVRVAAFLAGTVLFPAVIYSGDFTNLFGALLGMCAFFAVFHCGKWLEKLTAVLIFYPSLIAVNFLMHDIGSRCFFWLSGAPLEISFGWSERQVLLSTACYALSQALRLLFWTLSWRLLRRNLRQATGNLTAGMWLAADALMLAPLVAIFTIIWFMPENTGIAYPICGACMCSGFGCVYFAAYLSESMRTAYRARELEEKQRYYRERLDAEEQVRRVYHDMKNHLLVLQRQAQPSAAEEMLEQLQRELPLYEDYVHTGNEILDIILKEKAGFARERGIRLSVTADLSGMDFLEPLDISTIFGNGLDNAIEASGHLAAEERVILMKAGRVRDFLSVLIENNCGTCAADAGKSAKPDRLFHGLGIPNMRKAVEKYGGQLVSRCENGTFTLKILIPVP